MHGRRSLLGRLCTALAALLLISLSQIGGLLATPADAAGSAMVSGFDTSTLPPNDDGSTGLVTLPFNIDFFGNTYSALYVNNNGNLTFNGPLSTYTPSGLTTYGSPIIAPFWADVDTNPGGSAVTYGTGTVNGHPAFGVNWPGVDCYDTTAGGLNYFQVLLIDRSDIAPGDFDIEFNYNQIQWDSGQASGGNSVCQGGVAAQVGYTNGSSNALELVGSGINGAFLDGGPDALISSSQNSTTPGRYIFPIRSGGGGGSIGGQVTGQGTPVAGALVSACGTGGTSTSCFMGNTDANGNYLILGVPPATGSLNPLSGYEVTASPPSGSPLNQQTQPQAPTPPLTVTTGQTTTQDFALTGPTPPPNHTIVSGNGTQVVGGQQIPVLYWEATTPFSTEACHGGSVSVKITAENSQTGLSETAGPYNLTETGSDATTGLGIFTGNVPALYPLHGAGTVEIDVSCAGVAQPPATFSIYIDPSGTVVDQNNNPIVGATVTLLNSDSLTGTFAPVPNGSAVMSPGNRNNPDTTGTGGQFAWDTAPGFYEVQATAPNCNTVTTPAFQVPPPQTNLQIQLTCTLSWVAGPTGPAGRSAPAMATDPSGLTLLFGGGGAGNSILADTWELSQPGGQWSQVNSAGPAGRTGASAVWDPALSKFVLFGGVSHSGFLSDTWAFDPASGTWSHLAPTGAPPPRAGAAMAAGPGGSIILFGGLTYTGYLSDTWLYTPPTGAAPGGVWTHEHPATNPSARYNTSAAYDPGTATMILFGGGGSTGYDGDTWAYSPAADTWTHVTTTGSAPTARSGAAMVYDAASGNVVLVGGLTGTGYSAGTYGYNPATSTWSAPSLAAGPSPRQAPGLGYDQADNTLVQFGGWNGTSFLSDTWKLVSPGSPL